jgi:hypothetical protein
LSYRAVRRLGRSALRLAPNRLRRVLRNDQSGTPPPCTSCRHRDTWQEQCAIAFAAVRALAQHGVPVWHLPARSGIRLGIDSSHSTAAAAAIQAAMVTVGGLAKGKVDEATNNKYEFDQVSVRPPAQAEYIQLHPAPHCAAGTQYLRRRSATVEFLSITNDHAVVPRAGLGPRVYARDQLRALEIQPDARLEPGDKWPFAVDLVYTWVDSTDPRWQEEFQQYADDKGGGPLSATNSARWHSRDELRFALRSAWAYTPFIRNIYVVTNGQVPSWLIPGKGVEVVTHSELFDDPNLLPTFSSRPIESVVHRIDGLSEHFAYLNDDFFFGAPIEPEDFFSLGGIGKIYFSNRHLDARPVSTHDRASVAAHKNTRDALLRRFGTMDMRKFKHSPYVMRRSVWKILEEEFRDELDHTRRNRFRAWDDINPVPFLYNHYALLTGYAVPANIGYRYVDIGAADLTVHLGKLQRESVKVFCVNDADSDLDTPHNNEDAFHKFLHERFPVIPPWEES